MKKNNKINIQTSSDLINYSRCLLVVGCSLLVVGCWLLVVVVVVIVVVAVVVVVVVVVGCCWLFLIDLHIRLQSLFQARFP